MTEEERSEIEAMAARITSLENELVAALGVLTDVTTIIHGQYPQEVQAVLATREGAYQAILAGSTPVKGPHPRDQHRAALNLWRRGLS